LYKLKTNLSMPPKRRRIAIAWKMKDKLC